MSNGELTPQERAAKVTYLLTSHGKMTTKQIAKAVGVTRQGAHSLMRRIARVVPVYRDHGEWKMCDKED